MFNMLTFVLVVHLATSDKFKTHFLLYLVIHFLYFCLLLFFFATGDADSFKLVHICLPSSSQLAYFLGIANQDVQRLYLYQPVTHIAKNDQLTYNKY